ncbi:MAG TPA: DUF2235 domain-containing protein [Thermoanaerobaculia bacterium]|nr:DUF2235 domain-containing protein [Thermoanaerobaculia bacterium]
MSDMDVVAAPRREKRLILCLDGTWNSGFEEVQRRDGHTVMKPTNPLKICRAVKPFDGKSGMAQITYYDLGVGALAEYPGTANRLLRSFDRTLGGAWGAGFEGNVEDALNFLAYNYEPGDEVYVFGFSRGAAQARAVTQFLDWNGGLPEKGDAYYLPRLFRLYVTTQGREGASQELIAENNKKRDAEGRDRIQPFRPVRVRFLGVWDTVMALGSRLDAVGEHTSVPGRTFYAGTTPARCVEHARQALALDEKRYDFRPEIWQNSLPGQTMAQRWFAGVHSNVGGSYGNDGLANVALHWIAAGAKAAGLALDDEFLNKYVPWVKHSLYESATRFYRVLDGFRNVSGDGVRSLLGHARECNLTLDRTVIERMQADPKDLDANGDGTPATAYRPTNVIELLAAHGADLPGYLNDLGITAPLPPDVLAAITPLSRRGLHVHPPQASAQAHP